MDQPNITVETPKDNTILAYGVASNTGRWLFLGGVLIVGVLMLGGVLIRWGLSRPFAIPKKTAVMISLTPRQAHRLFSPETLAHLSPVWRSTLQGSSRWPVLLGASRTENGWHTFALVLRWQAPQELRRDARGLVALLEDGAPEPETKPYAFLDSRKLWQTHPFSQAAGWIDPNTLFLSSPEKSLPNLAALNVWLQDKKILTSLAFQASPNSPLPKKSDISLSLSTKPELATFQRLLLENLPTIEGLSHLSGIEPTQIHVRFGQNFEPIETIFNYPAPLGLEQAQTVLGDFGIFKKRVIQLPDGSLANEQGAFSNDLKAMIGQKFSLPHGSLELDSTEIRFGKETFSLEDASPACTSFTSLIRLSDQAQKKLLESLQAKPDDKTAFQTLQLGASKGSLIGCLE